MQSNCVRGRNHSTGDDVVAVHQGTCNWLTDAVDVDRGSANEGDDEADRCGEQRWNHENAEPTHVNAVVGGSHPLTEIVPSVVTGTG